MRVPKSKPPVKNRISRKGTGNRVTPRSVATSKKKWAEPGPLYVLTEAWCKAAREALKRRGWTSKQLAEAVPLPKGPLSKILNKKQDTSPHVERICEVLGIHPPPQFVDERDAEVTHFMRIVRRKNPELYDQLAADASRAALESEPEK